MQLGATPLGTILLGGAAPRFCCPTIVEGVCGASLYMDVRLTTFFACSAGNSVPTLPPGFYFYQTQVLLCIGIGHLLTSTEPPADKMAGTDKLSEAPADSGQEAAQIVVVSLCN